MNCPINKMASLKKGQKPPHALCIPYPAQGHITPMLKLAKLLHHKGFHITFVNTEYNHRRLLRSRGPNTLDGLSGFRFETIPDGLPPSDADATQDIPLLSQSTSKNCLAPLCNLLTRLNSCPDVPPVTCIIGDGIMSFTLRAAEEFGVPIALFWTTSACGLLGYSQYRRLVEKGLTPVPDLSYLTNSYLETKVDWVSGMKNMWLRDFPSFIRTDDPKDILFNFLMSEAEAFPKANALILNTFDALERDALNALSAMQPHIYTIGPLQLMLNQIENPTIKSLSSNLWKEDMGCIEWLENKPPKSVVYVNFGSITVMTAHQLSEFAWGLAYSKKPFLWIIRPDIVVGDTAILPPEFMTEIKERGMLASWCPQEEVLKHPSIGGFLTHSGWNSTLDTICGGVPVICWPFFAEQQTNCRYSCVEWGIGMEIDNNVKREEVEMLVKELMEGKKGEEMRIKAVEWKEKAEEAAAAPLGSSYINFNQLLKDVILAE